MRSRTPIALLVIGLVACGRPSELPTGRQASGPATAPTLPAAHASPYAAATAPQPSEASVVPSPAPSSIDREIQAAAERELAVIQKANPETAAIVILNPTTGEVIANVGALRGQPANVALERAMVTGSTLKAITLAIALEERAITPEERFDCGNGARKYPSGEVLRDPAPHRTLPVADLLAVSTNVGFSKIFDRLGGKRLIDGLRRFHFGVAPALAGAVSGDVPSEVADGSFRGGVLASGELATATALQMAAAFAVFANQGEYVPPTLTPAKMPIARERVLRPEVAAKMLDLLVHSVESPLATGKGARVEGFRVAGKTGTSWWKESDGSEWSLASFVGIAPVDKPRFVVFVGASFPDESGHTGVSLAAPAFARLAKEILARPE